VPRSVVSDIEVCYTRTMRFGLIPVEDAPLYATSLRQVELAEALGFHSVWLEERHSGGGPYHPAPLIFLAGYATRTRRLRLGTAIAILPLYHPVRVAGEVAQLDIMSNGRVIFGTAIGYRPDEFAAFQTPLAGRGAQFVDMLKLIGRLWTEEAVTFHSERYPLSEFTLEPRPIQRPRPPIWIGGWGELAVQRAATLGDAWLPGPSADLAKLKAAQARYHAHLAQLEIDPLNRARPLIRDVVIAPTDRAAEELAERRLLPLYRNGYRRAGHPLIGGQDATDPDDLAALRRERFIIGAPEGVVRQIRHFQAEFGMDELICRLHFPGMPPDAVTEAVRLIGREVIPAFPTPPL
jgi:alkanesulfonate monooxygenase SsuD/methylene tetrahydromethanopterin reductase-like flavin-dependent oxidoreductase (luciferase family)